ncbi:peptidoglycan-binding protein [Calidifontibacter terrae]
MNIRKRTNIRKRSAVLGLVAATAMTGMGLTVASAASAATRSCTATTPASSRPVLRYADHGSCVTQAQTRLRAYGASISADGSFGPATLSAVRSFQRSKGLAVDGVVGPITWSHLVTGSTPPPSSTYRASRCGNNGNKVLLVFDDTSPSMSSFRSLVYTAKVNGIGIGVAPNGNAVAAGRADPGYARANGMLVVDHTYDHRDLTTLSNAGITWEITRPQVNSNYLRPPYGATNARVNSILSQNGKYSCLWNLDPRDWDGKSAYSAANYIVRNARPGSTVVVHLNHMGKTPSTLAYIKKGLANRGIAMCAPWSGATSTRMPATYCA